MAGHGTVGTDAHAIREGRLAASGAGDGHLVPLAGLRPRRRRTHRAPPCGRVPAAQGGSRTVRQRAVQVALEAGGGPRVVMVDDADLFVLPDIDQNLRSLAQSGRDRGIGLVIAATAETMTGAMGWLSALKRHRKGVLLGPQSVLEGDFIGARLAHAHLRGRKPGRALTVAPGN